jgi:hypothetical protein
VALATTTLQVAVNTLKRKVAERDKRIEELETELVEFRDLQWGLAGGEWLPMGEGDTGEADPPARMSEGKSLRESFLHLAEIFVKKYPDEDDIVVKNLVKIFIQPVEEALEGQQDE